MLRDEIIEMARQANFLTHPENTYIISPHPSEDADLYEELEAFAKLVAAKEREHYEGVLTKICVQCRSNEWGPLTHKKEILNWFHDFAANALERGEA